MADGIRIKHSHKKSATALFPLMHVPMGGDSLKRNCPRCGVIHPYKTVHLAFDDAGCAVVSTGVYRSLVKGHYFATRELTVVATIRKPPTLVLGQSITREEVDYGNRKQAIWSRL